MRTKNLPVIKRRKSKLVGRQPLTVKVISMTNMATSNISVLDETSVPPNNYRKEADRTSASLNSFQLHFMVVCHTMNSIPRVNFIKIISTSMGSFACWG